MNENGRTRTDLYAFSERGETERRRIYSMQGRIYICTIKLD